METDTSSADFDITSYRNMVLDEVIDVLNQLRGPFGNDTIDSFQIFIEAMKD